MPSLCVDVHIQKEKNSSKDKETKNDPTVSKLKFGWILVTIIVSALVIIGVIFGVVISLFFFVSKVQKTKKPMRYDDDHKISPLLLPPVKKTKYNKWFNIFN